MKRLPYIFLVLFIQASTCLIGQNFQLSYTINDGYYASNPTKKIQISIFDQKLIYTTTITDIKENDTIITQDKYESTFMMSDQEEIIKAAKKYKGKYLFKGNFKKFTGLSHKLWIQNDSKCTYLFMVNNFDKVAETIVEIINRSLAYENQIEVPYKLWAMDKWKWKPKKYSCE